MRDTIHVILTMAGVLAVSVMISIGILLLISPISDTTDHMIVLSIEDTDEKESIVSFWESDYEYAINSDIIEASGMRTEGASCSLKVLLVAFEPTIVEDAHCWQRIK